MTRAAHHDPNAERARQALARRRHALLARDHERDYELCAAHAPVDPVERIEEDRAAAALGLLNLEEQDELVEIERALARIARGSWGLCEVCGHAIGNQLLRASPERGLCLSCELDPPSRK
jgi:DnaK suppressor protein